MNGNLALWWRERTPRERGLLAVMLALMIIVLGWLVVARPLIQALDDARVRHGEAVLAVAEARAEADLRRRAALRPSPAVTLPVDRLIGETAAAAGFAGARISGQGPARAMAAVDAARPQAFFAWIDDLQTRGLVVESLRAQANADRTLAAEAVLRVRSR